MPPQMHHATLEARRSRGKPTHEDSDNNNNYYNGNNNNYNNNITDSDSNVLTETVKIFVKKAKDERVKPKWRTNVPLFTKDTDEQILSKLQSLQSEGAYFEGELSKNFFSSTLEGMDGVSGNVEGAVGVILSSDNPDLLYF